MKVNCARIKDLSIMPNVQEIFKREELSALTTCREENNAARIVANRTSIIAVSKSKRTERQAMVWIGGGAPQGGRSRQSLTNTDESS